MLARGLCSLTSPKHKVYMYETGHWWIKSWRCCQCLNSVALASSTTPFLIRGVEEQQSKGSTGRGTNPGPGRWDIIHGGERPVFGTTSFRSLCLHRPWPFFPWCHLAPAPSVALFSLPWASALQASDWHPRRPPHPSQTPAIRLTAHLFLQTALSERPRFPLLYFNCFEM